MEKYMEIKNHLYTLEVMLLNGDVRRQVEKLNELLAEEFIEYSSSGKIYNKVDTLELLPVENDPEITLSDFNFKLLSPTVALTTYTAFIKSKQKYSLRSSVWKFSDGRWQMIFHQGTIINHNN